MRHDSNNVFLPVNRRLPCVDVASQCLVFLVRMVCNGDGVFQDVLNLRQNLYFCGATLMPQGVANSSARNNDFRFVALILYMLSATTSWTDFRARTSWTLGYSA